MPQTSTLPVAGTDIKASWGAAVFADIQEIYAGGPGVPIGGVIHWWSNNTVPTNYVVCDGSSISDGASPLNGLTRPSLTNKFIRGIANANIRSVPVTGGADTHTLTSSEIPSHTHSVSGTTGSDGVHSHSITDPGHYHSTSYDNSGGYLNSAAPRSAAGTTSVFEAGKFSDRGGSAYDPGDGNGLIRTKVTGISINNSSSHTHSFSATSGSAGSGSAHNTIPAYVGLVPIMRIK